MKKVIQKISETSGYKALYLYAITQEEKIPVVMVEQFDKKIVDDLSGMSKDGRIFLTEDDLKYGVDVYGVIFNHMQHRTELLWGEDVLKDIQLTEKDMIKALEAHLRRVLIDCREALVMKKRLYDVMPRIMVQYDRIWYACGFLLGVDEDAGNVLLNIVEMIDRERGIDHGKLYKTLHHGMGSMDLMGIHDGLTELIEYIDNVQ